jgi:DNA polymerase elongation subunit (family B)
MTTLALDIEVAGFLWEEVDEITRGYLTQRARTPEDREALPERTSLIPGLGKVIAIGLWLIEEDRGLMLLEGQGAPQRDWEKVPRSKIVRGSEAELLAELWKLLEKTRAGRSGLRLITYNGRSYDGPMLMFRSAQLGIQPSMTLVPPRFKQEFHLDLMEVFNFQGALRENYSLDYWCRRFDVESPKGGIDGSQVTRAYRQGRIEEIGEYCLRDVRATAQLYLKLKDTLLGAT